MKAEILLNGLTCIYLLLPFIFSTMIHFQELFIIIHSAFIALMPVVAKDNEKNTILVFIQVLE